jgi:hypothetical protein
MLQIILIKLFSIYSVGPGRNANALLFGHTYVLQHTLAIIRLKPLPKNSSNHAATYVLFILIIWIHNAADVFLRR